MLTPEALCLGYTGRNNPVRQGVCQIQSQILILGRLVGVRKRRWCWWRLIRVVVVVGGYLAELCEMLAVRAFLKYRSNNLLKAGPVEYLHHRCRRSLPHCWLAPSAERRLNICIGWTFGGLSGLFSCLDRETDEDMMSITGFSTFPVLLNIKEAPLSFHISERTKIDKYLEVKMMLAL